MIAVPPPAVTRKPRLPSAPSTARKPRSLMAVHTWSLTQPSNAILNLRGSVELSGWRSRYRVSASAYGVTSKRSSAATPASGQAVMLRTELPHASRVVRPASASPPPQPPLDRQPPERQIRFAALALRLYDRPQFQRRDVPDDDRAGSRAARLRAMGRELVETAAPHLLGRAGAVHDDGGGRAA